MTAQDIIAASRLTRVRELQTQLERAARENSTLATENAQLKAHLDLALLAAEDLRTLPAEGRFIIVDGWNMVLGDVRHAPSVSPYQSRSVGELIAKAKSHLQTSPDDFIWIVFDGHDENSRLIADDRGGVSRLRISYTGGTGPHRADRLICDFIRMAKFRCEVSRINIVTRDKDFKKDLLKIAPSLTF